MTGDLRAAVGVLAAQVGGAPVDVADGHARWSLYRLAMPRPEAWAALEEAVRREEDANVASSVVVQMLERAPADGRQRWVDALGSAAARQFAQGRADDLAVLAAAVAGEPVDPADRSRWLQERLAEQAVDHGLLARLADAGDTKRIRRTAAERLRGLRAADRP